MGKVIIILVLVVLFGGLGAGFLVTWDMPAPSEPREKIISNDRFSN